MALPHNLQTMREYCLRHAGGGAVKINITPEQLDDCIDLALQYLQEYGEIAQEAFYLAHEVTQNDLDTGNISLPDNVLAVLLVRYPSGIFPLNWASFVYGDLRSAIFNAGSGMSDYMVTRQNLAEMQHLLAPNPIFDFRYSTGKLKIADNLISKLRVGSFILLDCIGTVDPIVRNKLWKSHQFRQLAAAYTKRQYGMNLLKFNDMPTPGGILINADAIYQHALDEIDKAEEAIQGSQTPIGIVTA